MELSLVIPFFNEEDCAEKVAKSLLEVFSQAGVDLELVLVNNGSTDGTPQILRELESSNLNVKVAEVFPNQGYGWGVINGLKIARGDYLGYLSGDGQIKPSDVWRVFEKLRETRTDYAKVNRVKRNDGFLRSFISRAYNILFSLFFWVVEPDVNGTPKIFRREVYERLDLKSKDWFIDAEFVIKARRAGFKGTGVPVVFLARRQGKSHVGLGSVLEFFVNMVRYRVKPW